MCNADAESQLWHRPYWQRARINGLLLKTIYVACLTERARLVSYGMDVKDIGLLRGWSAEMCEANLKELEKAGLWGASKKSVLKPKIEVARCEQKFGFTPYYRKVGLRVNFVGHVATSEIHGHTGRP